MTCVHLQQLYHLCQEQQLKLSGTDLIRVVCTKCGVQEVCPSTLMDEYDVKHPRESAEMDSSTNDPPKSQFPAIR